MQKRILAAVLIVSFVSLLFASNANAQAGTMIASPDPIKLGEQIAVIWGVKDLVPGSWIGMFLAAPNSNVIARHDANPTVDGNGKGGVLYFTAVTPGQIQFRFFQNGQMYM